MKNTVRKIAFAALFSILCLLMSVPSFAAKKKVAVSGKSVLYLQESKTFDIYGSQITQYKYSCKIKGKTAKNKWKSFKVDGKAWRFYFGRNGIAYAGTYQKNYDGTVISMPVIKKISGKQYAFDEFGHMLKGIHVADQKLWFFGSDGKMNKTKSKRLQKLSSENSDYSKLAALLKKYGAKQKKFETMPGCNTINGMETLDFVATYADFQISGGKTVDDGKMYVYNQGLLEIRS